MIYAMLVAGAVLCAVRAIRANQLLSSALWLAGVSALVSIILYRLGAHQIAVIELSVGAGLVTVLFVFAISIAGDDGLTARASLPGWLTVGVVVLASVGSHMPARYRYYSILYRQVFRCRGGPIAESDGE